MPSWENLLHQSKESTSVASTKVTLSINITFPTVIPRNCECIRSKHNNFKNFPYSNFYLLDRDSCVYMDIIMQSQRAVLKKPYFYGFLNSPEAANDMTSSFPSQLRCSRMRKWWIETFNDWCLIVCKVRNSWNNTHVVVLNFNSLGKSRWQTV